MKNIKIKTSCGIGDLLHLKQLLDDCKHNYSNIDIGLDHNIIRTHKPNYDEYFSFINLLFLKLFSEYPYNIKYNIDCQTYNPISFSENYSICPAIPNLESYLCQSNVEYMEKDYIVVLTKIRGFDYANYLEIKKQFIDLLNKISIKNKIILVGERLIGMNPEYLIHGKNKIYSLYEDLKNNVNYYEDKTIEELGSTSPNIQKFYDDCTLLNKAKNVICLGSGGNVSMAMATSNIVNFFGNCEMEQFFSKMPKNNKKFLSNNILEFYNKLNEIV